MQHARSFRRSLLLAFSLLSACAAAGTGAANEVPPGQVPLGPARRATDHSYGEYLTGRFAASRTDLDLAATDLLKALSGHRNDTELLQQAFIAALMDGRPEAKELAEQLPDNAAAQLLLADTAAQAGDWDSAEQRFRALSHEGLTLVLQPLLIAWAQQGQGRTDAALNTLRPVMEGERFRGVYALHAAMIADLAGRTQDAARLYQRAQTDYGSVNLRLSQILASWQARQGQSAEANQTLKALTDDSDGLDMALPDLKAKAAGLQIRKPADGVAEAYLALAAALRQQDASGFSMLLLQLSLSMRPDFTPARLLMAEILQANQHPTNAMAVLSEVPASDPLISIVRLRRATLMQMQGNTDGAMRMLDQLSKDYPARPEPLLAEGDILRSKSRFEEAAAAYGKAIARVPHPGPENWSLYYARGVALEQSKEWPQAEADLLHALQLAPDQPNILNYLGYSWAEKDENLPRARQMLERAAEARPNDGSIIDSLGWVLLRQGETVSATHWLERAVELDPDDSTINGHLGDAYWAAGRRLEALYQWQRALTLKPAPDEVPPLEAKLRRAEQQTPTTASASPPTVQ